jgi:hypothetical protein
MSARNCAIKAHVRVVWPHAPHRPSLPGRPDCGLRCHHAQPYSTVKQNKADGPAARLRARDALAHADRHLDDLLREGE